MQAWSLVQLEASTVIGDSEADCGKAESMIRDFRAAYPEVMRAIRTRHASHAVLAHKGTLIQHLGARVCLRSENMRPCVS